MVTSKPSYGSVRKPYEDWTTSRPSPAPRAAPTRPLLPPPLTPSSSMTKLHSVDKTQSSPTHQMNVASLYFPFLLIQGSKMAEHLWRVWKLSRRPMLRGWPHPWLTPSLPSLMTMLTARVWCTWRMWWTLHCRFLVAKNTCKTCRYCHCVVISL